MTHFGLELSPTPAAVVLAAAAVAALVWHLRRSTAGGVLPWLRAAATACLVLALLKPTLAARRPILVKPRLAILVDSGHSMGGKASGGTRLEAAQKWLAKNRKALEARADVRLFSVAGRGKRLAGFEELSALKPAASSYRPADSLRDVLDDSSSLPERAWLFSDGNADDAPDLDAALAAARLPIDAVAVGPERRGRSLDFIEIKPPDFAFLHGRFDVQAVVEAAQLAGVPLRLRLLRQDPGLGWQPVTDQTLIPPSNYETLTSTLSAVALSLGRERFRLEAYAGAEAKPAATRDFGVEVVRQKYRIMYLSGRPSPEYAFLRDFLKSDPNRELVSFVILRNPDNPTLVSDAELSLIPFPAEEIFVRDISQFDLFILENFSYARFHLPMSYLESIKNFVANGGALLVIGGENAFGLGGYRGTPIEDLLPVTLSSQEPDFLAGTFQAKPALRDHPLVKLYDTAQDSEAAWQSLPPLDGWARFSTVKPGSTVLVVDPQERTASGSPLPVIALRDYGRGKVMLLSSDSTWRWKLGAAEDWRASTFYSRFWTRAIEYLTGSLDLSKVKFAPLPDRLPAREPAVFTLRVFDDQFQPADPAETDVTVLWTPPGQPAREVTARQTEAGVYQIELTGLAAGAHVLKAAARFRGRLWGQDSVRFDWQPSSEELPVDRRWLKRVADATGGSLSDVASLDASALLDKLPPVREEAEVRRRYEPAAAPLWLAATALLWILEWALRRRRGLP